MSQRKSQNGKSAKKRALARLDWRLERMLLSYAVAATAAGLGMLTCSPQAEATVVYTPTWIPIAPISSVTNLDLNNDGIADFQISNKVGTRRCGESTSNCFVTMRVLPQSASNAIWGTGGSASALGNGVTVGSQGKFQAGHEFMAKEHFSRRSSSYGTAGPWKETTRGYLGLKFIIQGQVHYGWARLNVTATTKGIYGAISGYAYETVPNKPIRTGQQGGAARKKHNARLGPATLDALRHDSTGWQRSLWLRLWHCFQVGTRLERRMEGDGAARLRRPSRSLSRCRGGPRHVGGSLRDGYRRLPYDFRFGV
jgi:hypothetical protein